ncbi:lipocalin-like domain-containing protein [Granulosicoccus antarcticus]|uniref:AttH domain-containing protein n=1 Tax=Granulosicoccus antarcticus IMCC3135 TaxID=1192854 RepID=A0A2Z2NS01_9GAMM|nr:lipocalin-like domain-containing protein [Granulosicoccus antarcticus]ASJ73285.1 hypothetical protein IMCC3135_16015 [Granulosicoccus antarcticus IMCC3135]
MTNRMNSRRVFLRTSSKILGLAAVPGMSRWGDAASEPVAYPSVYPGAELLFPQDHGAHPDYRTEWWYLTASLDSPQGPMGLQITFFRSRTPFGRENPSRFAPEQLVLAHAALALPEKGSLLHDQQAWRQDDAVAQFSVDDTDVAIGLPSRRWSIVRTASDHYQISVRAEQFQFDITAVPPSTIETPVLQGRQGFSQKGPDELQASYYYSRPQLQIEGEYKTDAAPVPVTGTAWLDHEWSSELLDSQASGWDWVGLNFDDGSALMAFQMRAKSGEPLYTTARHVTVEAGVRKETDHKATFTALRYWESSRTDGRYPVSLRLQAGGLDLTIVALFDDQELDSRGSTGVIYWEGIVQVWQSEDVDSDGVSTGEPVASGYLELTGYAGEVVI